MGLPVKDRIDAVRQTLQSGSNRAYLGGLMLVFVCAMAVRLWFNFVAVHPNNFAACDAFEYINNGKALLDLVKLPAPVWGQFLQCLLGIADAATWASVRQTLEPLKDFYISGPVFPIFCAATFLLTGASDLPVYASWDRLVFAQSLFSAFAAVLTAAIATRLYSRRVGLLAGALAAFYPGFIINSGRLYSESFACFLLCAVTYLVVRGFKSPGPSLLSAFVSGLLAGTLQLTRSVMVVVSLALLPLAFIQQRKLRRFVACALIVMGLVAVTVPWVGFQKLAFGKSSVVVDRVGHYNFFIGNNINIGGWLSYPYPDGRGVEDRSYGDLLSEQVKSGPERWAKLMLDKPARLFKFPWNDFRTAIGPFDFVWQVIYQQFLLFLSLAALPLCVFGNGHRGAGTRTKGDREAAPDWDSATDSGQLKARLFVVGLLAFHCVYFSFITVPRYNLTAMPEIIILAAAGAIALVRLCASSVSRLYGLVFAGALATLALSLWGNLPATIYVVMNGLSFKDAIVFSIVIKAMVYATAVWSVFRLCGYLPSGARAGRLTALFFSLAIAPAVLLNCRANGRASEWSAQLPVSGRPVKQVLSVPFKDLENVADRRFYLLLDTSKVLQTKDGLSVKVNGTALDGPVIPGLSLVESFDRMTDTGGGVVMREGERMWDSLCAAAAVAPSGLRQWSVIPVPPSALVSAAQNSIAEGRDDMRLDVEIANNSGQEVSLYGNFAGGKESTVPSIDLYSWEKCFYGVENPAGLTDTRYDIKLPSGNVLWSGADLSGETGHQSGAYNVRLLAGPPGAAEAEHDHVMTVPVQVEGSLSLENSSTSSTVIKAPTPSSDQSLWMVRVRGKVRRVSGDACGSVMLSCGYLSADGKINDYRSPWTPRSIGCSDLWRDFEVVVPVKPQTEKASVRRFSLSLGAAPADTSFNNVYKHSSGDVEFRDVSLDVVELPANPSAIGHRAF